MRVPPKKHLLKLNRVVNESLVRNEFLRMDKNENLEGFSQEVVQEIREIITSEFLTAYPEVDSLYKKLAECLNVEQKQIYLTAGSDAGIKSVFEVYVEPGDEVVIIHPTYAMYYVYSKMFQARLVEVAFNEDLTLSPERIIENISPATKLICIPNPNSPTGTILSVKDLENIVAVSSKNGSLILIDEAYHQFWGHSFVDRTKAFDNLIVTRTFSKALGLASARLGYIVSNLDIISSLHRVRPMYEVNAFAVGLGLYLLHHPHLVAGYVETVAQARKWLEGELSKYGFNAAPGYANFILIDVGGRERAKKIEKELFKEKIVIKGGFSDPCLKPYIRVGLGTLEQMKIFLEKFCKIVG